MAARFHSSYREVRGSDGLRTRRRSPPKIWCERSEAAKVHGERSETCGAGRLTFTRGCRSACLLLLFSNPSVDCWSCGSSVIIKRNGWETCLELTLSYSSRLCRKEVAKSPTANERGYIRIRSDSFFDLGLVAAGGYNTAVCSCFARLLLSTFLRWSRRVAGGCS